MDWPTIYWGLVDRKGLFRRKDKTINKFASDIAAALELALIGSGLVVLYFALKEDSRLLKTPLG